MNTAKTLMRRMTTSLSRFYLQVLQKGVYDRSHDGGEFLHASRELMIKERIVSNGSTHRMHVMFVDRIFQGARHNGHHTALAEKAVPRVTGKENE